MTSDRYFPGAYRGSQVLIAIGMGVATPAVAADRSAIALVRGAIEAQGGEQALRAVTTVQWLASGYRNALEQSERPEGPYIQELDEETEAHDQTGGRIANRVQATTVPFPSFTQGFVADLNTAMRVAPSGDNAGNADLLASAREALALSPERLMLTALTASSLQERSDETLQSVRHHVVTFDLDGAPVRLFLNANTRLPTRVEYSGPLARTGYWRFLGDATMQVTYGFWWLAKGGVRFPLQRTVVRNGLPEGEMTIHDLRLNEPIGEASLTIPAAIRAAFQRHEPLASLNDLPLGNDHGPMEIASGILLFPGAWNVTLVRQEDGIVVIEAPISSGYSAKVLAEAESRFPGVPIKAVITTSDSWPHLAGIREYAARGIPIYGLDQNESILRRVIAAPYTSVPDLMQRQPRAPVLRLVNTRLSIGSGGNRIELFPLRGETSERQMAAYFPALRLLYGSDPFQKSANGTFAYPQTVSELEQAVKREHLEPKMFFMMHVEPTPWSALETALLQAGRQNSPTSGTGGTNQ